MNLGVILTTSGRELLCALSAHRLEKFLESVREQIPGLKTFVVLADDGSKQDVPGPWDVVIKHPEVSGIQRSFSAAYAVAAPWTDVILHLEDDRPLIDAAYANVGRAIEAFENDGQIGAFTLFNYFSPPEWIDFVAKKGVPILESYNFHDIDIDIMGYNAEYPWPTFNFNCTMIRSSIVRDNPLFGTQAAPIGSLEGIVAKKVHDAGMFGAHSPQLHALVEDRDPGHSPGWEKFAGMGMAEQ